MGTQVGYYQRSLAMRIEMHDSCHACGCEHSVLHDENMESMFGSEGHAKYVDGVAPAR